jgi:ribonuclease G
LRNISSGQLNEIITDIPEIHQTVLDYISNNQPEDVKKLRLYQDTLLSLYRLYSLETVLSRATCEKVWLASGGFLMIQPTDAFVAIDVNTGKYQGKKKASETYRKINLEAAQEIAIQLRLRNLSGIILIDFINMTDREHQDELFHMLQKYLRRDSVKAIAIDITPLHIMEMTRQKIKKSLSQQLYDIKNM